MIELWLLNGKPTGTKLDNHSSYTIQAKLKIVW